MKVLVIYEQVPEEIDFYVFKDPSKEVLTLMKDSHGSYINCSDSSEKDEKSILDLGEHFKDSNVTKLELKKGQPFKQSLDMIVQTGIYL